MRPLRKLPTPDALVTNERKWTDSFVANGGTSRPWGHDSIKNTLIKETDGKCAYCEADMLDVSFGDIEHIRPKSVFPELVVNWSNLTLACSRCNGSKGEKYNVDLAFINPYTDNIATHMHFWGAVIWPISDRGTYTVKELGLNLAPRVLARERTLKALEVTLRRWEEAKDDWTRRDLGELIDITVSSGEYTAFALSYAQGRKRALEQAAAFSTHRNSVC